MAFYIKLTKEKEDESFAQYRFASDSHEGTVVIDKKSGITTQDDNLSAIRAAAKLRKERAMGHYPEETTWAS